MFKKLLKPFQSRKFRLAFATVAAGVIAQFGFDVSENTILVVMTPIIALILGIAIEDHGTKSAGNKPEDMKPVD